jgi:RNA polymerase sigma-70 factor (ECF subfamily)
MEHVVPDSAETQRLLEEVRTGSAQAFDQLLTRHRPYLQQLVDLRMDPKLRQRLDPSDVVQEAQIEAARRLENYLETSPLPFRLWLRQLAQDRLLMMRRRHIKATRRTVSQEIALPDRSSLVLAQQLLSRGSTPSQRASQKELVQRVRHAMTQLPDADREVLLMRTFEGLSFDEIGCLLHIDAAAARKRHGRALLRLHKTLTTDGLTDSHL